MKKKRKCDTCQKVKSDTRQMLNSEIMCKDCFMECDDFVIDVDKFVKAVVDRNGVET